MALIGGTYFASRSFGGVMGRTKTKEVRMKKEDLIRKIIKKKVENGLTKAKCCQQIH